MSKSKESTTLFNIRTLSAYARTAMTVREACQRKTMAARNGPGHEKIHAEDCLDCETKEGLVERIKHIGNTSD